MASVAIPAADVKRDVDAILWSLRLHKIRRYFHQRFWEEESREAEYARRVEPDLRLETVSEHSWHVADTVLLLVSHFPSLNPHRCLELAILHDKLEGLMGDWSPVGRDGTGSKTHAFNQAVRGKKDAVELEAAQTYSNALRPAAARYQRELLIEMVGACSQEACFVKAVDKLQALAYVLVKKDGRFDDKHLEFTAHYSSQITRYYSELRLHREELFERIITSVAHRRRRSVDSLRDFVSQWEAQSSLFGPDGTP